jgi:type VI protein secretion system component VasK
VLGQDRAEEGVGAMTLADDFGTGQVFWSMLWFFLWIIWIWMLVVIFGDIFRSPDLSGWGKALWTIFVLFIPFLGVLVYLIARGSKMQHHAMESAKQQDAQFRQYVQQVTSSDGRGSADELARLAELRDRGVLNDAEFAQAKAKALGPTG